VHDCPDGGTKTVKVVEESGDKFGENGEGTVKFTKTYKNCNDGWLTMNGVITIQYNWKQTESNFENSFSGSKEDFTYEKDGSKYVVKKASWSGKWEQDLKTFKSSKEFERTVDGKMTFKNGRTVSIENFNTKTTRTISGKENTVTERTFSIEGAITDSKYKGIVVVKTPKTWKSKDIMAIGSYCVEEGKITVDGKGHTASVEVVGEKVVLKFDDEEVKSENRCNSH
jgi:hypothetical protein